MAERLETHNLVKEILGFALYLLLASRLGSRLLASDLGRLDMVFSKLILVSA
jgi:hypothetical protein